MEIVEIVTTQAPIHKAGIEKVIKLGQAAETLGMRIYLYLDEAATVKIV